MAKEPKVPKEKKVTKVSKIRSCVNQGWKDVAKIAEASGASIGTVKTQMYKYLKEKKAENKE